MREGGGLAHCPGREAWGERKEAGEGFFWFVLLGMDLIPGKLTSVNAFNPGNQFEAASQLFFVCKSKTLSETPTRVAMRELNLADGTGWDAGQNGLDVPFPPILVWVLFWGFSAVGGS